MKNYTTAFLILFNLNVFSANQIPTEDQILAWSKNCPNEQLAKVNESYGNIGLELFNDYSIFGNIHKIGLLNKEVAYLAKIYLNKAGRNFSDQTLLIRPSIKIACVLGPPITHNFNIYDLDNNGVSEIIAITSGSGGGITRGKKTIVQLDTWNFVILREKNFQLEVGGGSLAIPGIDIEIAWEFKDIDGDGILDLNETRKVTEERFNRKNRVAEGLYRYVFKDNKFIRYVNYKK